MLRSATIAVQRNTHPYETGHFGEAKAELAAALPNLKRYRAKSESGSR